ncbi:hypothetical protein ACIRBX_01950 [Kitasatospora sp. NPDC096147]|uniref:hypothetical protein n=1 Tax=Kitasatospora sp. NPDC096147 TaxID=3364093 RepID=UPI003821F241
MTADPSAPAPARFDAVLAGAFAVLLGGGSGDGVEFGAQYAVFHADDSLDEFLFPNAWCRAEVLADPAPRELPYGEDEYVLGAAGRRFLPAESLFRFDPMLLDGTGPWGEDGHKGPRPFDAGFGAAVRAVGVEPEEGGEVLVRGAELAALLTRYGVELASVGALNGWLGVVLRVDCDGTLDDAMRAATFTTGTPAEWAGLPGEDREPSAADPWQDALAVVPDAAVRRRLRHLSRSARDARAYGARYRAAETWPAATESLAAAGHLLVAGWEFGECQAGTAVVRLAGPERTG